MANTPDATEQITALLAEDRAILTLLAETAEHSARIDCWLLPALDLRRMQRDYLRHKLEGRSNDARHNAGLREHIARLERDLEAARNEVNALRGSLSWKATQPIRAIYRFLSRLWSLARG